MKRTRKTDNARGLARGNEEGLSNECQIIIKDLEEHQLYIIILTETKRKSTGNDWCVHFYSGIYLKRRVSKRGLTKGSLKETLFSLFEKCY
jgi:hypothetical protein